MTLDETTIATPFAGEDRTATIRDHLRDAIIDRRPAPDTKLSEAELGTLLDASHTVVRAALQALAFEGLVRIERNRGPLTLVRHRKRRSRCLSHGA